MAGFEVNIKSNVGLILQATQEGIEAALEAIGLQAEGYAKGLCPTDTGRLKNSITHVTKTKAGRTVILSKQDAAAGNKGTWNSVAISEDDVAYIGTGVYYAPYVEMGHIQAGSGKHVPPKRFLQPALENHVEEYKRIAEKQIRAHLPK